ncbi:MAG: hypothetical protein RR091_12250 [Cloacibacillus sp.]
MEAVILHDAPDDADPLAARKGVERHVFETDSEQARKDKAFFAAKLVGVEGGLVAENAAQHVEPGTFAIRVDVWKDPQVMEQLEEEDEVEIGYSFVGKLQQVDGAVEVFEEALVWFRLPNHPKKYFGKEEYQYVFDRVAEEVGHGETELRLLDALKVALRKVFHLHLDHRKRHEECFRDGTFLATASGY